MLNRIVCFFQFFLHSVSELFVESNESGPERIAVYLNISLVKLKCECMQTVISFRIELTYHIVF